VPPGQTFFANIQWMATTGLSTGSPQAPYAPLYKPADPVSRQAMAAFLYRYSGDAFTAPAEPTFDDVDATNPFFAQIEWMAAEGISTGTPQPSGKPLFNPGAAVSREVMAIFLARFAHATLPSPTAESFADVPLSAASAPAIEWMKTAGISTGTTQPSGLPLYKPQDPVSRQAMAAFLQRLDDNLT
jgi:S-layer family protein